MKKKLFTLAILFITVTFGFGQQNQEAQDYLKCIEPHKTKEMLESLSPTEREMYHKEQEELLRFTEQYIKDNPAVMTNDSKSDAVYTIPVVFHVIHFGGNENISDEQVEDCIRIMNDDYKKLNNDVGNVNAAFLDIAADTEIEFKLAKKDPNGDCTNGITRTMSPITFDGTENQRISVVQGEHGDWRGDRYMNVFVVAGFEMEGVAGYTYRPSNWVGTGMGNGIHILHTYVGSIGTGSIGRSRTMTHEAGHWLNLPHLWGGTNTPGCDGTATDPEDPCYEVDNCNDDDGISDTPNTIGWQVCNVNGESCGSLDNVENYMEYSYCSKMFTLGQKARMHAALNSSVGGRNNVVSESNLEATGVFNPDIICRAEFESNNNIICPGGSIAFLDRSFSGQNEWTWTFPGGTPASSTEKNPSVIYENPGVYEVSLTVSDGSNSASTTKQAFINVLNETSSIPFTEGFEEYDDLLNSPWVGTRPQGGTDFVIYDNASYSGEQSIRLNNFGLTRGTINELVSSPVDLSSIDDDVTMSFRYAYRKRSTANEDWLRIFFSSNCGEDWALRRNIRGDQLGTNLSSINWHPLSDDDWVTVHVTNITSQFWVDNFMVKFQFESDGGNNFYMDNINIYKGDESNDPTGNEEDEDEGDVSVVENEGLNPIRIYPNPTTNNFNISFSLSTPEMVHIQVVDALGQTIENKQIQAASGENLVLMQGNRYTKGVYFVKVHASTMPLDVKKLIVK